MTYVFGNYIESVDGKIWHQSSRARCDCDAQAELTAQEFCYGKDVNGIYIKRGGVEWFCVARGDN